MVIHSDRPGQKIAILTFSEVTRDPRIRRAAELMVRRGHEVRVFTFQFESAQAHQDYKGFRIVRLPLSRWRQLDISLFCDAMGELANSINFLWPGLLQPPPLRKRIVRGLKKTILQQLNQETLALLDRSKQNLRQAARNAKTQLPGAMPPEAYSGEWSAQTDLNEARELMQLNVELFRGVGSWATHIYANDLETLFAGAMLKHTYGTCLIYDAHEIWPHQWPLNYKSPQFLGFYSTMERLLLRETDERITVGEGLASYFRFAYASEPFTVIPNTPSIQLLVDEGVLLRRSARRGLLYHGIYAAYRGLEEIMRAEPLIDDGRIAFRGIGEHGNVLRALAKKQGSERIEFLPPVPVDDLVASASEFDIGLLPFVNSCLNTNYAFPNKLFEYMMAGLAIAATDLIDQRRIVMEHQMGIVFDINNREQVAGQLNHLLRNPDLLDEMRRNAWMAARDIYNWENSAIQFGKVLSDCGL